MFFKNHIIMLTTIIFSSLALSLVVFLSSINHWFRLIIVIVYVRGIIVLFIFIVSLAPNEKNPIKKQNIIFYLLILNIWLIYRNNSLINTNFKTDSILKWNCCLILFCTTIVIFTAYIPPKIIKSFLKGIKTSK